MCGHHDDVRVSHLEDAEYLVGKLFLHSQVSTTPYPLASPRLREELKLRMRGMADYFHVLLKEGGLARVLEAVQRQPAALAELLPIVANPKASINVRLGASVVFEQHAGAAALRALVPALGMLAMHGDARVRADACHFLGLAGAPEAAAYLEPRLADENGEVREIAAESLDALNNQYKETQT